MFYDLPSGKTKAGVVLNFDDTTRNISWINYHNDYGHTYKWKATFYCDLDNTAAVLNRVIKLGYSSHEIANHGENGHPGINQIPHDTPAQFTTKIQTVHTWIETNVGQSPRSYAWQIGHYNPDYIEHAAANSDYEMFRLAATYPEFYQDIVNIRQMTTAVMDVGALDSNFVNPTPGDAYTTYILPWLEYARDNNKILMIYGHTIGTSPIANPPAPASQTTLEEDLNSICQFIIDNNMEFYGAEDLVDVYYPATPPTYADPLEEYGDDLFHWFNSVRDLKTWQSTSSGFAIIREYDKASFAYLVQTNTPNQASLVGKPLNNKPIIRTNGTSDRYDSSLPASAYNFLHNGTISYTIFGVFLISSTNDFQRLMRTMSAGNGTGFFIDYVHSTTTLRLVVGNGTSNVVTVSGTSCPHNAYFKFGCGYNATSGNYEMWIDNLTLVTAAPTAAESASGADITLNVAGKLAGGAKFFGGDRAEIVIVQNVSPSDGRTYAGNWANQEWGLTL